MRKGFVGSLAALLVGSGLALAEDAAVPPGAPQPTAGPASPIAAVDAPMPRESCSFGGDSAASCPDERIWISGEYLWWRFKNSPEPIPLAATRTVGAGRTVTFGGQDIDTDDHSGARITIGGWLTDDDTVGAEFSYFVLADKGANLGHTLGATEFFPYVDPVAGPSAIGFSAPTITTARATLTLSQFLQGYEVNGVFSLARADDLHVELLGGYRYLDMSEDLGLRADIAGAPGGPVRNLVGTFRDQFNTRNQFYGGNLGARLEAHRGAWFVNATAKIALGDMHERLSIAGNSAIANGGNFFVNGVFPGQGVLAQRTNDGVTTRDRFAVAPEAAINVGYEIGRHTRVFAGYDFLYISDMLRPGAQLSNVINTSNVPAFGRPPGPLVGANVPQPTGRTSDFWAQGVNLGLQFGW